MRCRPYFSINFAQDDTYGSNIHLSGGRRLRPPGLHIDGASAEWRVEQMNAMCRRIIATAVISCSVVSVDGCALYSTEFDNAASNQFIPSNRAAGVALLNQAKGTLSPSSPIIMATLVDINFLETSSTMGRVISEQISAAFSQAGYRMIEMKIRDRVYIKRNEGELLLTRELVDMAKQHEAQAVIVGTYGVAADTVFVNLKIVQPGTNVVLGAHDYALPKDNNVRAMLPPERYRPN